MKKLTIILGLITLIFCNIFAQTPEQFKYQAILRDASGDIIASQAVVVNIKILQGSASGTEVFTEDHAVTTTAQGLININIGDTENLSVVDWSADIYFVKITVDGTEMGTSQLLSVPYAMNAKTADNAYWNYNNDEIYYLDNKVAVGTNDAAAILEVGRNDAAINSQVWIDQDGTGDATIGFQAGSQIFAIGIDQSDGGKFKITPSYSASGSAIMTYMSNGNVGIGTSSPTAALHVDGTTKIGANGKAIAEIIELTGITHSTNNYISVSFPTGYTNTNTRILSLEIQRNGSFWKSMGATLNGVSGSVHVSVSDPIWIYYPNDDSFKNRSYRLTIMKVE